MGTLLSCSLGLGGSPWGEGGDFAGGIEAGTSLYVVSPVKQTIYPNRNAAPHLGKLRVK